MIAERAQPVYDALFLHYTTASRQSHNKVQQKQKLSRPDQHIFFYGRIPAYRRYVRDLRAFHYSGRSRRNQFAIVRVHRGAFVDHIIYELTKTSSKFHRKSANSFCTDNVIFRIFAFREAQAGRTFVRGYIRTAGNVNKKIKKNYRRLRGAFAWHVCEVGSFVVALYFALLTSQK